MEKLPRKLILAGSSGWVAAVLNVLPGLGAGYIYQRRWQAYWYTSLISLVWALFSLTSELRVDQADPALIQNDQVVFYGMLLIAATTAAEAGFAVKKARELIEE